ncbi:MAG: hypothetical protein ACXWEY_13830 [Bacteroidia bacterium]
MKKALSIIITLIGISSCVSSSQYTRYTRKIPKYTLITYYILAQIRDIELLNDYPQATRDRNETFYEKKLANRIVYKLDFTPIGVYATKKFNIVIPDNIDTSKSIFYNNFINNKIYQGVLIESNIAKFKNTEDLIEGRFKLKKIRNKSHYINNIVLMAVNIGYSSDSIIGIDYIMKGDEVSLNKLKKCP